MDKITESPILLTGCARSGTSMTAGILHKCGAFGGSMSGPTKYNRKGMFENTAIRNFIVKPYLREELKVDPMGQKPLPDVEKLVDYDELHDDVIKLMWCQGYKTGPWFYKGAKLCLIWPIWHKAFPKAKWVIVRREDDEVINSCMKTAFMRAYKESKGWQEWIDIHKRRFTEMHAAELDIVEIWPSKFVGGDFDEIKKLVADLGLKWNGKEIMEFIEPALWSNMRRKIDGK